MTGSLPCVHSVFSAPSSHPPCGVSALSSILQMRNWTLREVITTVVTQQGNNKVGFDQEVSDSRVLSFHHAAGPFVEQDVGSSEPHSLLRVLHGKYWVKDRGSQK